MNYLAADEREGRLPGTRGYDESAQYVADQFAAVGLEPGGTDGWFQQVPIITRMIEIENSGVTLHKNTGDVDLEWKKDLIVYADRLRPENRIRAEVVFVGFGIHAPDLGYSDYDGIDVSGKIVATFRRAPATFPATERAHYSSSRTKAAELVSRGAIGQITLSNRLDEKISPWDKATQNVGTQPDMTWIDEGGDVADFHPEHQGYARFSRRAAELLFEGSPLTFEEALDAAEDARPSSTILGFEVTMYRKTEHERMTSPNVVGILRGSDPELAREYVVYTSHLDHLGTGSPVDGDSIYNGMYDNALGVAMIIEAARVLAALPVSPRRSIAFVALTGEEYGLFGSDYFAHYPTVPSSAVVANVNIDMPMVIFPFDTVVGYGAEHSSLEGLVEAEVQKEGFELTPDPFPEEVYFIRTDQYSFVRQGIPSVYLAEGVGSSDLAVDGLAVVTAYMEDHWHQPSDDLSQPIEWETALKFARATVRVGYRIATEEQRPTWNEGDFFGEMYGKQ
ncbi:MAG: M28 family peptidase [Gammaproteobacteria bacterium]|nr:M28 family peptidase [Gammaproteobacteria bacterium]